MGWQGHYRNMQRANNCWKGMRRPFRRLQVLTLTESVYRGRKGNCGVFRRMCIGPERVLQNVQWMSTGVDRGCIDYDMEFNAGGKGRQGIFIRTWVFRSNLDLPYCDLNISCVFTDDYDHIVPAHYTCQRQLIVRQVAHCFDVTLFMDFLKTKMKLTCDIYGS